MDDQLATNVAGIWAMGDCNGRGAFTHTAYNDFEIIAANLLDGETRRLSQRITAYALYIDPPLGRVGMTEAQARASGRPVLVSKRPMSRVGRAIEKDETQGFMKIAIDAETRKILGAAILGTGGDEAIHGVVDMMHAGQTADALRWAVPIHPTVSELLPTLILDAKRAGLRFRSSDSSEVPRFEVRGFEVRGSEVRGSEARGTEPRNPGTPKPRTSELRNCGTSELPHR